MDTAPSESAPGFGEGSPQFRPTHWSVVLAAGDSRSPEALGALERLCRGCFRARRERS